MDNRVLKMIKKATVGILIMGLLASNVMAAQTVVQLKASQKKAGSAQIGNTTGAYDVNVSVDKKSAYSVDTYLYYGETSDHCGKIKKHWITAPGKKMKKTVKVKKSKGTTARITMYSNRKKNETKKVIATGKLSNH